MKILHITNWYPLGKSQNGNFIERHYKCAKKISDSELLHVQVTSGKVKLINTLHENKSEKFVLLTMPIKSYRLIELLTTLLLIYALVVLKIKGKKYDLYVFHIAYPLLTFANIVKKIVNKPMAILEHWTAYSQNFNLPENSSGRKRIANIFHNNIPVITVSKALQDDIVAFAKIDAFDKYIIPNVIDDEVFYPKSNIEKSEIVFFMLANWSSPHKRLMLGIEAFCNVCKKYDNLRFRIGGNGSQLQKARRFLESHPECLEKITFLGQIEYEEVGKEMRNADCFLHPTAVETFSLVCAEALFCETPVLASDVPPIPTFVNQTNGKLISNNVKAWTEAIQSFIENKNYFKNKNIGEDARNRFSPKAISQNMQIVFNDIVKKWSNK